MHYGYMDLFSRRNIHNVGLSASAKPIDKLTVKGDLHFFWFDDTSDAWYNAAGLASPSRNVQNDLERGLLILVEHGFDSAPDIP